MNAKNSPAPTTFNPLKGRTNSISNRAFDRRLRNPLYVRRRSYLSYGSPTLVLLELFGGSSVR